MLQLQIPSQPASEPSSKRKATEDEPEVRRSKRINTSTADLKGKRPQIISESDDGGTSSSSVPSVHTAASDSELPVPTAEDEEVVNIAINSFLIVIQSKFHD
jgi:hypothetical protein